jgi:hypothetical protein
MMDKIIVSFSLLALYLFCGVVLYFVAVPDLVIITILMLALATNDFWISVFRRQEPAGMVPHEELEERFTAVSGKPLDTARELEEDVERSATPKRTARKKPAAKGRSRKK